MMIFFGKGKAGSEFEKRKSLKFPTMIKKNVQQARLLDAGSSTRDQI